MLFLIGSLSTALAEPGAAELLAWTCSEANLPTLPALPVDPPSVAGSRSERAPIGTLVIVGPEPATPVTLGPSGNAAVAIDRAVDAAVAAEVLQGLVPRYDRVFVVMRPDPPAADPPVLPEVEEAASALCPAGVDLPALYRAMQDVARACPALVAPVAAMRPSVDCGETSAQYAEMIARCPDHQDTILAALVCSYRAPAPDWERVVLVPVPATLGASAGGTWADAWTAMTMPAEPEGGVLAPAGDVPMYHHSELRIKRRINPTYPPEIAALGLGDQRCLVRVFIDPKGVPYDAVVERCAAALHVPTRDAVLEWRWKPPGHRPPGNVQTTIVVSYLPR